MNPEKLQSSESPEQAFENFNQQEQAQSHEILGKAAQSKNEKLFKRLRSAVALFALASGGCQVVISHDSHVGGNFALNGGINVCNTSVSTYYNHTEGGSLGYNAAAGIGGAYENGYSSRYSSTTLTQTETGIAPGVYENNQPNVIPHENVQQQHRNGNHPNHPGANPHRK